ncbi:MAG: cysteine--tRNA ligase [Candidatus Gastranaerophilales bacterium]|nr:cysteine--tRNA ligase [Candidatus Gastranaerophilales bacterium]
MKIYDTLSQELKDFVPIEDNKVRMYVCGPTVYDYPHLGHARCYITWDMVVRYLKFKGYDVTYVRNITDVDDKIINKARDAKSTPHEIAQRYYEEFSNAMEALNVASPDIEPKATENIEEMINIIKKLVDNGFAYESNGDIYFRVKKYNKYGKLSKQSINDLESGVRVEASEKKEDPLDFTLWKPAKTNDEISWESPWGKGRPGWHIECSAMVNKYLGVPIDIHAGGQDLIFPHHENEKAQTEAAFDKEFVKYWMHNGFVLINEEKMSKSLGNFVTINDLLEKYDSNTIRFFILTNHYRMPVEFNDEGLKAAKAGVKRLKNAVGDIRNIFGEEKIAESLGILNSLIDEIVKTGNLPFHKIDEMHYLEEKIPADIMEKLIKELKNYINAMDEDFNTSKALAVLFELANCAQKEKESATPEGSILLVALLIRLSEVLGFDLTKIEEVSDKLASQLMDVIISVRGTARTQKNWEIADKVRDELGKLKITLKDNKDGTTSWNIE